MDSNLTIILIILLALVVASFLLRNIPFAKFPFSKKEFLLNTPEREFYERLQKFLPQNLVAFPQVVLSSIIKCSTSGKQFWRYQNKIDRKTIDFVIFERQYLKPVLAIEYDGRTHERPDRIARDEFVNGALRVAGIGSVHIRHHGDQDPGVIISEALENYNLTNQ